MKAAIFYPKEKIVLKDVPKPRPSFNEAIVKVESCGICGVDVAAYDGLDVLLFETETPHTYGHEIAGIVDEVGPGVKEWKKGDRVSIYPMVDQCGFCEYCLSGDLHRCSKSRFIGYVADRPGGFAEYVKVPARNLLRLPEVISFDEGALIADHFGDGAEAIRRCEPKSTDFIVIFGAALSGLCALIAAVGLGVEEILVADYNDKRLKLAKSLGAKYTVNMSNEDVAEKVKDLTGGRMADSVIEAISSDETRRKAVEVLKIGGVIKLMRVPRGKLDYFTIPNNFIVKQQRLLGGLCYPPREFYQNVRLLIDKKLSLKPLIGATYPLEEIQEAFAEVKKIKEEGKTVIIKP